MSWSSSDRRSRLPKGWPKIRLRILERDPFCRLGFKGCTKLSTEVDHIKRGDDHRDINLQGVCLSCHKVKTQAEARDAARLTARRRPRTEQHPGVIA